MEAVIQVLLAFHGAYGGPDGAETASVWRTLSTIVTFML